MGRGGDDDARARARPRTCRRESQSRAVVALGRGLPAARIRSSAGVLAVFRQRDDIGIAMALINLVLDGFVVAGLFGRGLGFYASASVWLAYGGLVLGARQAGTRAGRLR